MKKWIALATGMTMVISSLAITGTSSHAQAAERTGFVTSDGTQFLLDGSTFYYAGTNNYYLNFKPQYDVDQVIEDAAEMGLKVIRTWGNLDVGVKTDQVSTDGYPVFTDSIDGSGEKEGIYYQYFDADLGKPVVNEGKDGLQKLDYVIYKAEQEGIRLLITFTNNWEAFGGMGQYVKWAKLTGENVSGHDDFYTNETIKAWYKNYIETMLNHENVYTGIKYKDDPTIFSWELANEPRCESDGGCTENIVVNWASEMSDFVKSIDSNHMLAVGDEGFYNYGYNDFPEGEHKYVYHGSSGMDWLQLIDLPNIDYGTIHVYCDQWGLTKEQGNFWFKKHGEDAAAANKPVIVEEFGWKDRTERADVYQEWFDIFEGNTYEGVEYAGTNYWMLASLTSDGTLYPDYDTYTVYYKGDANGNPTQEACDTIMAHAERMNAKNTQNSVSPKKATFDIIHPTDLEMHATMELGSISGVQLADTTLSEGTDYTIQNNTIIISTSVLQGLELGSYKFTILTTEGNQPTVLVNVIDSNAEKEEKSIIDNFEDYADTEELAAAYHKNSSGDTVTVALDTEHVKNGTNAMQYNYSVEAGGAGYCGVTKKLNGADWTGFDGIHFWILSDGSNRETTIQFIDGAGAYWESIQKVTAETGWT
ncbi:MAG: cellulase family glycosylhydrolase, partial [Oscillospiraceae bacterium]|nr:cellulase family glycosylhydrolase [Oscillospiraceae bacterium]